MNYLIVKHKVENYDQWKKVFDSGAGGIEETGFQIQNILRDADDPNMIVLFFKLDDIEKAKAFTDTPEAYKGSEKAGVIGIPEVFWLTDY